MSASTQAQSTPQTRLAAISGGIAAELRQRLRAAADQIPGAELVPGFAVGDTSLVSDELEEQMLASSLTHLTAVSGSNISLICGAVIWCAARLGAGRRLRPAIAAAVLGGFVTVVGPDASVQRAAVMATVILVSGFGGKRAVSLPSLGIAMLVLLVADPWQALQPGFALSVAATAGILLLVPSLDRGLRRLVRAPGLPRAPQVLTLPISVAIAAQLACGPILLLLQPGIPAAGVLANVLAAPAAPLGTGIGLIGMVLLPLAPPAGEWAVALASLPARWVAATAEVTAALPLARWHWPEGWAGAILLAACEVAALLAWAVLSGRIALPGGPRTPRREPWRRAIEHPRRHRAAVAVLTGISAGTFVSISTAAPLVERIGTPANWSVVACDVGQGDALLLRDPGRPAETMLVDTGDDPELLIGCLERFGVRIISLLVLTHDDRDHVGALSAVVDRVEAALIAPPSAEDGPHRSVVRQLETAGVPTDIGVAGVHGEFGDGPSGGWNDGPSDRDHSDGAADPGRRGLVWEVLAPKRGVVPADSNSASVVLRVRADGVTTLLLADTGRDEHVSLLASGSDLSADVVKVAHHGSRDQDPAILVASGAEYGLISAGRDNGYGHPHPDVLSHLAAAGITALRTDLHGSLALSGPPGRIRAWVEHGGAGESGRAQR